MHETLPSSGSGSVDLYWLPLGAGGHCVRLNGRVFEALTAWHERRTRCDLYHSALEVRLGSQRWVIEMGPVWNEPAPERGAVLEGPVGRPWMGRSRLFRYEVRCWRGGTIPDADEAVESPRRLSTSASQAGTVLRLVPQFRPATWGCDEQRTGEMWNSNSLVSWLLMRSGHDLSTVGPPARGRAPGWRAGVVAASRELDAGGSDRAAAGPPGSTRTEAVHVGH